MWNPRELPPEFYKSEVERLQRENAELKNSAKSGLGFWSRYVFWKWLLAVVVCVLMIALAGRLSGPRGMEVTVCASIVTTLITIVWKHNSKVE